MEREQCFKQMVLEIVSRLRARPDMASVIPDILQRLHVSESELPTVSADDNLLLHGWQAQPDRFDGTVLHPLNSEQTKVPAGTNTFASAAMDLKSLLMDIEADTWEKRYFCIWRFWRTAENALLPADIRMPGSSFFLQQDLNAVRSYCRNVGSKPGFLLFQLGPVQEFIAGARSTRDLLSGSYMVAYLTASAMQSVMRSVCPGCIIFPNLRDQGICDAQNRELLTSLKENGQPVWLSRRVSNPERLLSPTLPNRFLALVPAGQAVEIAKKAEACVREVFAEISESVFEALLKHFPPAANYRARWNGQLSRFLQITWHTLPFDEETLQDVASQSGLEHFQTARSEDLQLASCDSFVMNWSRWFSQISEELAARRNTRNFKQFVTDSEQDGAIKDALTGKEEIIGTKEDWKQFKERWEKNDNYPFKENEGLYGAPSILKRLWFDAWLTPKLGLRAGELPKFASTWDLTKSNPQGSPYIAALAMDGDGMGKWISGEKTPVFLDQMAPQTRKIFTDFWKKHGWLLDDRMPVSPEYHLQFSEALANFTRTEARRIVEDHKGLLIYAGGDDVLALLPASTAVECARELRLCFRKQLNDQNMWLPGITATVSCGIAVGHFKQPLQALIAEARRAEHRAKQKYRRNALALSILKRSGEILQWGCSFDSRALPLLDAFYASQTPPDKDTPAPVSNRFANVLAQFLAPYQLRDEAVPESAAEIIKAEFAHVCAQQCSKPNGTPETLGLSDAGPYLSELIEEKRLPDFVQLFLAGRFLWRTKYQKMEEDESEQGEE